MNSIHRPASLRLIMTIAFCLFAPATAFSQVYKLPVPDECSSSKKLTLSRGNHPEKFTAYGKVDLYCGDAVVAKGATLCDSDYDMNKPLQTSVKIAVSTSVASGKASACTDGTDLKIVPQ